MNYTQEQIQDAINEILFVKGTPVIARRCWFMCYKVWKKLPKNMRKELVLVEGENHYWLQDKANNVYDIYSEFFFYKYDYSKITAKYDLEKAEMDSAYDETFGHISTETRTDRFGEIKEKLYKVNYFNEDKMRI